jgi:hypothetical protein
MHSMRILNNYGLTQNQIHNSLMTVLNVLHLLFKIKQDLGFDKIPSMINWRNIFGFLQ